MNNIQFTVTDEFAREFKRLKKKYQSLGDDIRQFKAEIERNPDAGVDLGSNLRKIRLSIKSKGKGKSGGGRIISYNMVASIQPKQIILVTIYDKNENDSISIINIKQILKRNGF